MSRSGVRVTSDISKNLRKFIGAETKSLVRGVGKAVLFVKGEAVQLAPIEFGPLRGSAFSQVEKTSRGVRGRAGFTARYAPFVHEAPMKLKGQPRVGGKGVYWQGGENKFLSKAVNRNKMQIIKIIAKEAKF